MSLSTYSELQAGVLDWLNRVGDPTLATRVTDFIRLAEAEIFRYYAARGNEVNLVIDRTAEDPVTDRIPLPADYREMLTFTCDGRPLTRTSLTQAQHPDTVMGWPVWFARELEEFVLQPFPDAGRVYEMNYYAKLTPLSGPDDTNSILTNEPGLYLYGALKEAQPFVKGDDMAMAQVWGQKYAEILQGIDIERDEEDRSGSNVEVASAFGGRARNTSRGGWA
jgi:hypothetical protein